MEKIAFIGLGNMGSPMAANLLRKGFDLTVFDLSASAMDTLAALGAKSAASAQDAVATADIVLSMLPAAHHVESLYRNILPRLKAGTLAIDCSTIDAATTRRLAQDLSAHGVALLDAPVSGGTAGAAAGTLTFMVGGTAHDLARAQPLLEAMGQAVFHAGESGAGQSAKICNNMLLGILMAGTAEALALGVKNGLDPAVLSHIMSKSSGRNWALEVYNPWPGVMANSPASRAYSGGFMSSLMLKDLGLARDSAQAAHANTPLGALAYALFEKHVADGNGAKDFSSIQQHYD
ncbi:3-hydroxyisobutyrate dehydrogenase [Craterilacuibacter sp. RT1T]|uniref:3-hydroxyisobutyrate dehydrogenase n=1 Tax=Craterilacuibacter sp. RT1T TaxID=2942211 RepID=UPI0020BF33AA|nr:3-hydroxyisobutyrate dehydrogenase [Craterilacuibacter sp. RT1T]MCL6263246.1 3-hydroxyisobutyrate dehydrogenase [Craterilacuibacter sp. RT1T]